MEDASVNAAGFFDILRAKEQKKIMMMMEDNKNRTKYGTLFFPRVACPTKKIESGLVPLGRISLILSDE